MLGWWASKLHPRTSCVPLVAVTSRWRTAQQRVRAVATMADALSNEDGPLAPLELPADVEVVMVGDVDEAAECIAELRSGDGSFEVGCDVEWCPKTKTLALLQLATRTKVFIIDFVRAGAGPEMGRVVQSLLECERTVKLGYNFWSDLVTLHDAFPDQISRIESLCDLARVHSGDASGNAPRGGLSALSMATLGRPLDKTLQTSSWLSRPLTDAQVAYAALDAWVLLQIHDALLRRRRTQDEELLQPRTMTLDDKPLSKAEQRTAKAKRGRVWQPRTRRKEAAKQQTPESVERLRAAMGPDIKFIADTMSQGLCRELRRFGFDCLLLEHTGDREQEWRALVERAHRERRVILTRDTAFFLRNLTAFVYYVGADRKREQFDEVQRAFGLTVDDEQVLCRCSACNFRLSDRVLGAADVADRVSEKARNSYDKFWECSNPQCGKVYWMGHVWANALADMTERLSCMRAEGKAGDAEADD